MTKQAKLIFSINSVIMELETALTELKMDKIEPPIRLSESIQSLYKIRNEIYPIYNYDNRIK